ncbi:MAG TPA: DNA cytosine methyltransferase [Allosphingosinicella sp.]|jgi:site-specific DNA-cytosine methylase
MTRDEGEETHGGLAHRSLVEQLMAKATAAEQNELMARVRERMATLGLSAKAAATLIGIGAATLQDHLKGEHVRSDSARKYVDWLAGRTYSSNVFALPTAERQTAVDVDEEALPPPPAMPRLVVDIFSGCGGLSLGFDLLDNGRQFRTILALDNQPAPIATLNRNAALLRHGDGRVGRVTDLTEFLNGPEFLAFYLQHVADTMDNRKLRKELHGLRGGRFPLFLDAVQAIDRQFLDQLNRIRSQPEWTGAVERLDRRAMNQTSVLAFHDRLRLPRPSSTLASLLRVIWSEPAAERAATPRQKTSEPSEWTALAAAEWDAQAEAILGREHVPARGQLSSSSRRLASFAAFLELPVMGDVREAWICWRAHRLEARTELFGDERFAEDLNCLYAGSAPVSVLVGGPPCQGFSRIGRGKIRSLRDARVHAHSDDAAGDARNRLFEQYVMVLGALHPEVFLFENVAHFKSVVKVGDEAFLATDLLVDAISGISNGAVSYDVSTKVIDASRHGVPQNRQRYFMAGVRRRDGGDSLQGDAATCLQLPRALEAPLSLALAALPSPSVVGGELNAKTAMSSPHVLEADVEARHPYVAWIRQIQPGSTHPPTTVDGHACRVPRRDDAALFALMGPGRRWMDYRADESDTLGALRGTLEALLEIPDELLERIRADGADLPARRDLLMLYARLDGALPLRLLLEQIGTRLGAPHHLLGPNYLAKRDGNHGDWVARMDPTRPAKTMVSHMGKDTYAYVHPWAARTISVREAARIQAFPDWFAFGDAALTEAYKMIGNAVPPMLSRLIASRVAHTLRRREASATVRPIRA